MRDEAEYYRCVLDNLTGGFLSVDLSGEIAYMNPMAGRILKLPAIEALAGKPFDLALRGFPALCGVIRDALEKHQTVHRAELSILHADAPMVIGYSTLQVKNRLGQYLGVGVIFQDLTLVAGRKSVTT